MTPTEFALIPGTTVFNLQVHPGVIDYQLPTLYTTVQQHTERKYDHTEELHVFEMKRALDEQMKGHIFLCFEEDVYVNLKQDRIGYTNISTPQVVVFLHREYGKKIEELQNKAPEDMDEEVDISRPSIKLFQLKQEKLKIILEPTEQAISDGMYIRKCLEVIERFNYINKDVLKCRAWSLNQRTIALFWLFFIWGHAKQRLKNLQRNDQANSVMLQKAVNNMSLKISKLKRYTDRQQSTVNELVDQVNDTTSVRSHNN